MITAKYQPYELRDVPPNQRLVMTGRLSTESG